MNLQAKYIKPIVSIAQAIAKEHHHANFSGGHLLMALLHNEIGLAASLAGWGKDIHYLREWTQMRIDSYPKSNGQETDPSGDQSISKILEVAEMARLKLDQDEITPEALLAAICRPAVAFTADQLKSFICSEQEVLEFFLEEQNLHTTLNRYEENGSEIKGKHSGALTKYSIDKVAMAASGRLDPIVGRDKETRQMMEVLGRRSKPNPIIVGEPGVGKSALIDGFAILLAEYNVPPFLKGAQLFELDSGSLIAGASYKGEVEDRLKKIIGDLKKWDKAILFIDEIHMLMDPNAGFGGVANLLKPELARGELTVIGATTLKEYREYIENDPAFSRRFEKILVEEPDLITASRMIAHISERYATHHGLKIDENTVSEAVQLSKRYISDKRLPDAAIDLIDNTMSALKIMKESSQAQLQQFKDELHNLNGTGSSEDYDWLYERMNQTLSPVLAPYMDISEKEVRNTEEYAEILTNIIDRVDEIIKDERETILPDDISSIVAARTNIPIGKINSNEQKRLLEIEDHLRKRVVGQDHAIHTISKAILESRAGLKKAGKPVGSFFFTGPTGTGKTELAKSLAEFLFDDESALIRFDMSEFKESVSAALLYGASPGYVGYKEGGLLVNKIREKPYSIVLFDEIEKAHASVFDVFLQILDEGRLSDKQGRKGDFSNAVILFTSNLGQEHIVDHHEKNNELPNSDWIREMYMNDPSITFRPEFLGRMDAIVPFAPLSEEVARLIFDIQVKDLVRLLKKQGMTIDFEDNARKYLAHIGYNPKFGARPIRDIIKTQLRQPLSYKIISGEISHGNSIHVKHNNEEIQFEIS